jgi:hypothetical protein
METKYSQLSRGYVMICDAVFYKRVLVNSVQQGLSHSTRLYGYHMDKVTSSNGITIDKQHSVHTNVMLAVVATEVRIRFSGRCV